MAVTYDSERVSERGLDETSWRILEILQADGRISWAELGRRVNLSSPAVVERVQRLEAAGIIQGYGARVNLSRLGYPVRAIIRIDTDAHDNPARNIQMMQRIPEVLECHRTTGEDCYYVKVAAADMERLSAVIEQLGTMGRTKTSMVLESPILHKVVGPDGEAGK
jgi:Lrp/AsnC family transcriptional regulator, leucine-responsive regulatory protein